MAELDADRIMELEKEQTIVLVNGTRRPYPRSTVPQLRQASERTRRTDALKQVRVIVGRFSAGEAVVLPVPLHDKPVGDTDTKLRKGKEGVFSLVRCGSALFYVKFVFAKFATDL